MKTVLFLPFLALVSCANAQTLPTMTSLEITGNTLPAIRHMVDMKMSGDTLLFVYDRENGYGQQFLRRAIVDGDNNKLDLSPDMGKSGNDYYVSYMPYPFIADDGTIHVISRDDCEIYAVENDTAFVRTEQYLMAGNSTVPFPLSQYVKDVFMIATDKYIFIGREPNGGRQYAMTADLTSSKIDTIRQIKISPELQAWMPNVGEMAYSGKRNRLAFAYRLHPFIELFGLDGKLIKSVRVGDDTFNPKTLDEADFEDLNPLHIVDITATDDYIYLLYWGHIFSRHQSADVNSSIYKLDWDGNIVNHYSVNVDLRNISVCGDDVLIGWTGRYMLKIML